MGRRARAGTGKVGRVMREFKAGTLRSSSGPKVRKRKQAIAIALSEARRAGARIPSPRSRRRKRAASARRASPR